MNTSRIEHKNTKMVAHRGVSGLEKENTNAAFVAAGNRSYFGIETDVHRTLDGKFVCIHDDNTERVAIDNLTVEQSTFETLRNLKLCDRDGRKGRSDLRIPTLDEYVSICRNYGKIGVLELKNPFAEEDIARIVESIREAGYLEGIIFISFDLNNLKILRRMLPEQPCQYLISKFPDELPDILAENRLDLDIYYPALTRERVKQLHERGIKVNCWTCDDPETAEELADWGVDFITSNILE